MPANPKLTKASAFVVSAGKTGQTPVVVLTFGGDTGVLSVADALDLAHRISAAASHAGVNSAGLPPLPALGGPPI